ncbi:MAG: helix-turn-helix transcriptional regulator [Deltaproteobacteria bacterium]|nr:helix-turn-helix transcriptional regulator [Deltaproteobacteria bacterium]
MKKIAKRSLPRPGRPVRGSSTGRPIMAALDLLGRRWTLRVLWELRGDALSFRALQAACDGVVPSVLATRLAELRALGLVTATDAGYELTARGRELGELLVPLDAWASRWARSLL